MPTVEEMMEEGAKNLKTSSTGVIEKNVEPEQKPDDLIGKLPEDQQEAAKETLTKIKEENKDIDDKGLIGLLEKELNKGTETNLIDKLPENEQIAAKAALDKIKEENKDVSGKELTQLLKKELDKKPPKKKDGDEPPETPSINSLLSTHSKEKYKNVDELITLAEKTPDINKTINEATEGKYKSIDELYKATQVNPFASDRIKKLNELEQKGVDITKILSFDSLGIDTLDPEKREDALQLLRNKLRLDEPDIKERELNFELKKYDISSEDMEDDEKENINMLLSRNAKAAKKKLVETKKTYELPEKKPDIPDTKVLDDLKKRWESNVSKALEDYSHEEFDLNGQGKVKYTLEESQVKKTQEVMNNPDKFLGRYVKDGKTDMVQFRRDMTLLDNQNSVMSVVFEQGKSAGAEELINSISNLSPEKSTTGAPSTGEEDTPEKAAAKNVKEEGA